MDFLKMDCEGGEWSIEPDEIDGIRRIEAEIHSFNGEKLEHFVRMLKNKCYRVNIKQRDNEIMVLSAEHISADDSKITVIKN